MRYRFITEYRKQFPIRFLCRLMRVSPSGYYAWLNRKESNRARENRLLLVQIKAIYDASRRTSGWRRIHIQLGQDGVSCSVGRLKRLMRREGIRGRRKRGYKVTTDSNHSLPVAPNLLKRNFKVSAPNRVWVSDITFLPCQEGWGYLATVMDLHNRQIVGWAMGASLGRSLTLRALEMAIGHRRPQPGLIHHSDRGSQYACSDYQSMLAQAGMVPSMSRKGDPWDNAPQESFFSTLKTELEEDWFRLPREQVCRKVFDYIEVFYNRQRLHSALGYLSPVAYAAQFSAKSA